MSVAAGTLRPWLFSRCSLFIARVGSLAPDLGPGQLAGAHGRSWTGLALRFVILAGVVRDGEQALSAVQAADEDEIRARLTRDPWAPAGLLQIGTTEHCQLRLDSRASSASTRNDARGQDSWCWR